MHYQPIHSFDLEQTQMQQIQADLSNKIALVPYTEPVKYVCGVDLAYFADQGIAVIIVMEYESKQVVEMVQHQAAIPYEYIPGFLAFRELPIFLAAWEKLTIDPDLVFFDGNGILHPHRVGLATHAAFFIEKPTIGIAKNHFIGSYKEPAKEQGSYHYIYDQQEIIGAILRTQTGIKPVYISAGNWVTLENAIDFAIHFVSPNSRIPEIIRQADLLTKKFKREMTK